MAERRQGQCGALCADLWSCSCTGTKTSLCVFSLSLSRLFSFLLFSPQLVRDNANDVDEVNRQLELMGYNMGTRLVDEFMARSGAGRCVSFEETSEVLSRTAFKMFLGVSASVSPQSWSVDRSSFALLVEDNPLAHFVELPEDCKKLKYSSVLCGVIRGALEMLQVNLLLLSLLYFFSSAHFFFLPLLLRCVWSAS